MLDNGHSIKGSGIYMGVTINVWNTTLKHDFLLLSWGGLNVILGMHWLSTLGWTHIYYKDLILQLKDDQLVKTF